MAEGKVTVERVEKDRIGGRVVAKVNLGNYENVEIAAWAETGVDWSETTSEDAWAALWADVEEQLEAQVKETVEFMRERT